MLYDKIREVITLSDLAFELGITKQAVSQAVNRGYIPDEHVVRAYEILKERGAKLELVELNEHFYNTIYRKKRNGNND